MNLQVEKLPKSVLTIKASLDAAEFAPFIEKATQHVIGETELPGFRKGKAPADLVIAKIGEGHLLEEAANMALRDTYAKALQQENVEAIGRPEIRVTKLARGNPFEWEATISVVPPIDLADYRTIAATKVSEKEDVPTVTDEEVEKSVEWLRKSRRPEGADENTPLPEFTDEFAQSVGNFKTAGELRETIKTNMTLEKEAKAKDARRMKVLESIVGATTMDIPDILVEAEKQKMLRELQSSVSQMGMKWEDYLAHVKKTLEDLYKEWGPDAAKRVRFALVLREIAKRESLGPKEEELSAWADQYLMREDAETRKQIDREALKDYAYGILRNENVFRFLENQS